MRAHKYSESVWHDHATNEKVMRRAGMEQLPRHCYKKEKENGWPHPQTAERKTRQYQCTGPEDG